MAEIGVGMLGLRVHGKGPFERVQEDPVHHVAAAARAATRRHRGPQRGGRRRSREALRLRVRDIRLARSRRRRQHRAVRQRRAELAARGADDRRGRGRQARDLREAARARRRRGVRHLATGGGDRRQAPVRVQLPLRPGDPSGARDDRGRRAGGDPALPRPLPPGLGRRPDHSTRGGSTPTRQARARSATSART